MILQLTGALAAAAVATPGTCAECGAQASGNFCSECGADVRPGGMGLIGAVTQPMRRSFAAVYLRLLTSPVKATVALAEDRTYRAHVPFLLSGIAVFCLLFVPILLSSSMPVAPGTHVSDSMQNLLKVLSQVGVYVGSAITFFFAYALFRFFSKDPRTLQAYFKLYCLAFGFVMPLYAVYEYLARGLLHGIGMSSFNGPMSGAQWLTPSALISAALALVLWSYFIAIHRRFWRMSLWKASLLYIAAALSSYQASFWLMYFVGYWTAAVLIKAGIVTT